MLWLALLEGRLLALALLLEGRLLDVPLLGRTLVLPLVVGRLLIVGRLLVVGLLTVPLALGRTELLPLIVGRIEVVVPLLLTLALEFVLPDWVERAAVEDGEIVIYTKPEPFSLRVR